MFCLIIFTLAFIPSPFFLFHFPHLTALSHLLALYHSDSMSEGKVVSVTLYLVLQSLLLFISTLTWENATGKVNLSELCFSLIYSALLGVTLHVFASLIFLLNCGAKQSCSYVSWHNLKAPDVFILLF